MPTKGCISTLARDCYKVIQVHTMLWWLPTAQWTSFNICLTCVTCDHVTHSSMYFTTFKYSIACKRKQNCTIDTGGWPFDLIFDLPLLGLLYNLSCKYLYEDSSRDFFERTSISLCFIGVNVFLSALNFGVDCVTELYIIFCCTESPYSLVIKWNLNIIPS